MQQFLLNLIRDPVFVTSVLGMIIIGAFILNQKRR